MDVGVEADLRGRLVSNTAAQLVAPGLRVGVGVLLAGILGRYLGITGFGEYGLVVAYVLLLTNLLADWGLSAILLREISRHPERRATLIASAAALQLVLGAASYGAVLVLAILSAYSGSVRWSLAVFGLTLLFAPVQMLSTHFLTDLRAARLVAPAVAGTLTQLVLVIVAVALSGPLVAIVAAGAAGVAVEQAWTAAIVLRELRVGRPSRAPWKLFVAEAWSLGASTAIGTAARQAPVILLAGVGMDAVGVFSAAEKIPNYLTRVPYAFRATMLPLLSRRWGGAGFAELVRTTVAGTLAVAIPLAVAGALFGAQAMALVFGAEFGRAGPVFAVLMLAFVFVALGILLEAALVAMGRQRANLVIRAAASALLLALLAVLVPRAGAIGSAAAVLSSSAAIVVLTLGVIWRARPTSAAA